MKSQLSKGLLLGAVALVCTVLSVQSATYITGQIAFTGGATLNGPLGSATAFTSFFGPSGPGPNGPAVSQATGDYAAIPLFTPVAFNAFTFNPAPLSSFQLWTVNVGGTTYSFDLSSVSVVFQSASFLNISGTGFAHADGFLDTPGEVKITMTGFQGATVFTFGSVAAVPEPSTSALVLGAGLVVVALRRFRSRF